MEAVNSCRFIGKLVEYRASVVGDNKFLLGKGQILLPDDLYPSQGQRINICAWEETAERLAELKMGTWIQVLTSYQPSSYKGKLQDTFTVSALQVFYE